VRREDPPFRQDAWSTTGFLLWHATMRWQRELARVLAPLGLTYAQFTVLGGILWLTTVEHVAHPNQRDVADHVGISPMMASQVVRKLEQRGLVRRRDDPADSRAKRVAITERGRAAVVAALEAVDRSDDEFFRDVLPGGDLVAVLRRIARRDESGRPTD
jgi:DNA-binding MarR family transcriptional regulator